jgi:chloramphenicol-sensitive protein RarD
VTVTASYLSWGLFPLFFASLRRVEVWEVVSFRVIGMTLVLTLVWLVQRGPRRRPLSFRGTAPSFRDQARGNWFLLLGAAAAIGTVWWVYSYGVVSERAIDVSLGYFACPFVGLLLAGAFERETISRLSWIAGGLGVVALAVSGVLMGEVPWVALTISTAFALYSLFKKRLGQRGVADFTSLYVEGIALVPVSAASLMVIGAGSGLSVGRPGFGVETVLLVIAGPLTLLPLWWFSMGVRRLRLGFSSTLQFVNPAMQLLVATLLLHEPMTLARWIAMTLIWLALACMIADAARIRHRPRGPAGGR